MIKIIGTILSTLFFLFSNYLISVMGVVVEGDSRGWGAFFIGLLIFGGMFVLSCIFVLPFVWSSSFIHSVSMKILLSIVFTIIIPFALALFSAQLASGDLKLIPGTIIIVTLETIWTFFLASHSQIYLENTIQIKKFILISGTALIFIISFVLFNLANKNVGTAVLSPVTEKYDTEYVLERKTYVFPDFDLWYEGESKDLDENGKVTDVSYGFSWLSRYFPYRDNREAVYNAKGRSYLSDGDRFFINDPNDETIRNRYIFNWVEEGKSFKITFSPEQAVDIHKIGKIGIDFISNSNCISVVYKDSQAEKAGIHEGDCILEIDGSTTEGLSQEGMGMNIIGEVGSDVLLKIKSKDSSVREVKVRREYDRTTKPITILDYGSVVSIKDFEGENRIFVFPDFLLTVLNDFEDEQRLMFSFQSTNGRLAVKSFSFNNYNELATTSFMMQGKNIFLYLNACPKDGGVVTLKPGEFIIANNTTLFN